MPDMEKASTIDFEVEAKKLGLSVEDVQAAVAAHWRKLSDSSKS